MSKTLSGPEDTTGMKRSTSNASITANIVVQEPKSANAVVKKKAASNQKLILCTHSTRYAVIKKVCRRMDFKLNDDENCDWDLFWSDTGI